ncbi:MAG: hypothetical protein QOH49_53 [Acidobacteriota bacterium]|nr:hypothetical protein [Acidobacteriota bacterium]
MFSSTTFTRNVRGVLCALAVAALLTAGVITRAQHQGHNMQDMPGMDMSKPKAKPKAKRKARAKAKSATRRKKRARPAPKKHDMGGMNMNGMPMPQHTPAPSQSPGKTDMRNMPGMQMPAATSTPAPSASPQKNDMRNMPGMQMPATTSSPAPQASPSPGQKMDMSMPMNHPMPQTGPSSAAGPATSGGMGDMPGMTHDSHTQGATPDAGGTDMPGMGSMNMGPLLVMSENDMGIRVGSSQNNIMSMSAMGSGSSWQPSSAPMHMYYKVAGEWLLMFHFNLIAGLNRQGGPRGVTKFESQNWFMPMAYRKVGRGTLQLRGMFSAEPFTFPPGGSPLLFQTGETYKGRPIIDRQHPHDLFMELSAQYTLPVGERGTWFTYFAYPGEPALGPVAFMHRMSASENPSATLSHHLQDSTHISFGVLTTGFTYRWLKLEGSVFNGREPDENRYDFDAHKWNSRSARLQLTPNKNWAAQVSYGFLRSPEAQEPDADVRRVTASVQYNKSFDRGNWASALVWGRNHISEHGEARNLNGYTFESTVNFLDKNYAYTRLELVDKDELLRASDRGLLGITNDHPSFRIGAYTFGGARDLWNTNKLSFAVGSDLTFYSKPAALDPIYGNNPVSWKLFFRIRPGKMDMSMHGMHGGSTTPGGQPEQ